MDNTEKVSVNINIGTLSQIDLLVDQGFYSNRSDFINQAVREYLNNKQDKIRAEEENYDKWNFIWFIGLRALLKNELEPVKIQGRRKEIRGYGVLLIDESLDDIVIETISSIHVNGKVKCSDRIKDHYQLYPRGGPRSARRSRGLFAFAEERMTLGLVDIFEVRADGGVDCHHEKAEVEGRAHRVKDRTVADEFAGLQDQAAGEYGKMHQEDKAEQGRALRLPEVRNEGDEKVGAEGHGVSDSA